ncbi:SIMPL domain-containing protein [Candidatus Nomurabacteria bacterium]|nr:SIMPL domain-containing protein [Candidatus Nomurabacteria bacterium]
MTINFSKRDIWRGLNTVLLATTVGLLLWSQPWQGEVSQKRTISTSGEGTVSAEADEFTFNPSYDFKGDTSDDVIAAATNKADEVTKGLEELGIEDKDITVDASSYENWYTDEEEDIVRSNLYMQIVVDDKDKAQEVQDYLLTTSPAGSLTPTPGFSDSKQKELAAEARKLAIEDARTKADQSATELGLKVGKALTVEETENYGGYPIAYATLDSASSSETKSLPIRTGEQDYTINVNVTYEVK